MKAKDLFLPILLIPTLGLIGVVLWAGPLLALAAAVVLLFLLILGIFLFKPGRVIFIFLALLPIYQLTLVLILHTTGSTTLINALQPWKEVLALAILVFVLIHSTVSGRLIKLNLLDKLVLLYFGINLAYLFVPWGPSLVVRLYGFRANAFLVVLYYLGRSIPFPSARRKLLIASFLALGLLTSLFAFLDIFILPPDWPARIGLLKYLITLSGEGILQDPTYIGPYGLPWTYWTSEGMRRASSFFANPLDMAASIHITGITALIVAFYFPPRSKGRLIAGLLFCLISIALILSISRASILVFAFECWLVSILTRKRILASLIVGACVIGLVSFFLLRPSLAKFIVETITFQNPSSQGHLADWLDGLEAILSNPLGLGLGSSGFVGSRFGNKVGGESQYIILGVEIGLPGLFLYILIQLIGIFGALKLFRKSTGTICIIALLTAVSRIGLAIVGMTAHIEIYLFPAYISWWLIGLTNQLQSKRREAEQPIKSQQNLIKTTSISPVTD